jgi:hypothetical protein
MLARTAISKWACLDAPLIELLMVDVSLLAHWLLMFGTGPMLMALRNTQISLSACIHLPPKYFLIQLELFKGMSV